jgi:hypothetical protein
LLSCHLGNAGRECENRNPITVLPSCPRTPTVSGIFPETAMQTEHAVGWLNSKRTSLLFSVLAFALTADFDFLLSFSWFCVSNPDA